MLRVRPGICRKPPPLGFRAMIETDSSPSHVRPRPVASRRPTQPTPTSQPTTRASVPSPSSPEERLAHRASRPAALARPSSASSGAFARSVRSREGRLMRAVARALRLRSPTRTIIHRDLPRTSDGTGFGGRRSARWLGARARWRCDGGAGVSAGGNGSV